MSASGGIDQLGIDTNLIAGTAHTALEHIPNPKFFRHLSHFYLPVLE